ncbi:hypothetical protein ACIQAC_29690 [Streptomyces sp. NPDC088387]|uniref:hypothetical protein n=1 Tax=Streptomyces sp. NPDC088387 TaxID=3365859 RepID=UPI0038061DA8
MSDSDGSGIKSCDMVVDKTLAVTTTQAWIEEGKDTAYFAAGLTLEKLEHSDDDGQIRYTGNEAFGKTRTCVDKKQELYVAVQAQGSKHRDSDAMKQLIEAYINEVQRSDECKDGAP